jgi:hypothetical protein
MQSGTQSADEDLVSGWVGNEDMGYGPASYYKNQFVKIVARKLERWTLATFIANCAWSGWKLTGSTRAGGCNPIDVNS